MRNVAVRGRSETSLFIFYQSARKFFSIPIFFFGFLALACLKMVPCKYFFAVDLPVVAWRIKSLRRALTDSNRNFSPLTKIRQ